ncbi:response regulator transcription factor [Lachnoclostridium sp. Marseille-P6806]|uniref:response regulator transcription factor n=1 Tax=Lachnoclostridium sp. Marseille-P6806 TaxID=2364793 RepID=UPI001030E734|nr:response regulator [Lachnoclostridium sp. Marseille-P6806]
MIAAFKVLVADDEPAAVKAICLILQKSCPEFEVVATACDGEDAYKKIRKHLPDLVITDISMPLMEGTELAQKIKDILPEIRFVIISGYQNFEYMRSAIQSGVLDYIAKPVVPSALTAAMQRVRKQLKQLHYDTRNRILRSLCLGETTTEQELARYFPYKNYFCGIIRRNGLPNRHASLKSREVFESIDELYSVYGRDEQEELFLIPEEILGDLPMHRYIDRVRQSWPAGDGYLTAVYCSAPFPAAAIREKTQELYAALNAVLTIGRSRSVDLTKTRPKLSPPCQDEISGMLGELPNVQQLLETRQTELLREKLRRMYARWETEERPQLLVEAASEQLYSLIRQETHDATSLWECEAMLGRAFYDSVSMEMLWENLSPIFFCSCDQCLPPKIDSEEYFSGVKSFIRKNLSKDLTLPLIADHFAISQTYLSRLFRKYTGCSYSQYLTSVRMEQARALMDSDPQLLIKDIAAMVGYHDQFYFSRIFRSCTGLCPSDYIDRELP